MVVVQTTQDGAIHIEDDVIAVLAGSAALECYGLVGMASRHSIRDGLSDLLGRENLSKGVEIRQENGLLIIDLYIVVSYGTRISEVAHNVQTKVRYVLNDIAGIQADQVNIIVQGVRVMK
jgi:uncharacterized alkaline shock family protein YloU